MNSKTKTNFDLPQVSLNLETMEPRTIDFNLPLQMLFDNVFEFIAKADFE
jgi:hypothetical protein